jgi:hypothetical protein
MRTRAFFLISISAILLAAGCSGGSTPRATPTPSEPGPEDVIAQWVRDNRNVDFAGNCSKAQEGVDVGKLCVSLAGSRGTRQAYYLGPTFSDSTALIMIERKAGGWTVLSVTNRDPSAVAVPGIAWPLQQGDAVVVIGLGDTDCLRIREQPTQQGKQLNCVPDGTKAIVQEGPVEAETFQWWHIAGDGFNGWAAGTWLRLPDAIAQALQPAATPTAVP